jgi:hypothetical protein
VYTVVECQTRGPMHAHLIPPMTRPL